MEVSLCGTQITTLLLIFSNPKKTAFYFIFSFLCGLPGVYNPVCFPSLLSTHELMLTYCQFCFFFPIIIFLISFISFYCGIFEVFLKIALNLFWKKVYRIFFFDVKEFRLRKDVLLRCKDQ